MTKETKGAIWSSADEVPLKFWLTLRIQGKFWKMLDDDFKRKVDEDSIHKIFDLVFNELNDKQLINILNKLDPDGLANLLKDIS